MGIARQRPIAPCRCTVRTPRLLATLALVAVTIIWGTTVVATKPVLERVSPLPRAGARFAIALIGVVAVALQGNALGMSMPGDGLVLPSDVGLGACLVLGRHAFPEGANPELVAGGMVITGVCLTSTRPAARHHAIRRVFHVPAGSPA